MKYCFLLFMFTVLSLDNIVAQNSSLTNLVNCVEEQNGADNLLINGRPYSPSNSNAKGHPYYQTKEWQPGKIYINGTTYLAKNLKYNLFKAQLIIKHERPNGTSQKVVLSDFMIDSFQINEHLFVNRALILSTQENRGYLEKIFTGKLSFFRFQQKVFGSISNLRPYGQFTNLKDVFILLLDDKSYKISQKKEFLACFPNHKTEIKKYLKTNSLKWKNITKTQFIQLLKFCNDQI